MCHDQVPVSLLPFESRSAVADRLIVDHAEQNQSLSLLHVHQEMTVQILQTQMMTVHGQIMISR